MARFRDIDINFTRNPRTGDVAILTDENSIRQSIKNIVQLNGFEKPYHPERAGNIRHYLFENFGPITKITMEKHLENAIKNNEPRIIVQKLTIYEGKDANSLEVQLVFRIRSTERTAEMSFPLERLR